MLTDLPTTSNLSIVTADLKLARLMCQTACKGTARQIAVELDGDQGGSLYELIDTIGNPQVLDFGQ